MDDDEVTRDEAGNILAEDGTVLYKLLGRKFFDQEDNLVDDLEVDEEGKLFRWLPDDSDEEVRARLSHLSVSAKASPFPPSFSGFFYVLVFSCP